MLNLGLRKTKKETTAPQIISFHRTLQRKKHKHRTPKGLRSLQHRKLRFYSPHHRSKKTSTPQHHKSPCPPLVHVSGNSTLVTVLCYRHFAVFGNRPFPSFLLPLFQNESMCETFHCLISHRKGLSTSL